MEARTDASIQLLRSSLVCGAMYMFLGPMLVLTLTGEQVRQSGICAVEQTLTVTCVRVTCV